MEFSNSQLKAIQHYQGPMLVIAGPGSGKTTVVIQRIRHLIEAYSVPPPEILTITFSRAAAEEIENRFSHLCPQKNLPIFGTFHSIFYQMLKHSQQSTPGIITEREKYQLLRAEIERFYHDPQECDHILSILISDISKCKSDLTDPHRFHSDAMPSHRFAQLFEKYQQLLSACSRMDFDDILIRTYQMLCLDTASLQYWQNRFRFILADEFQDINFLQYKIIKMLAAKETNFFAVGDDDQSIYAFRGAIPDIMLQFSVDYPECETILLDTNYRCPAIIQNHAADLIRNNRSRILKNLRSANDSVSPVYDIRCYPDQNREYENIADRILHYHESGIPFAQIAVLLRGKQFVPRLVSQFEQQHIPFASQIPIHPGPGQMVTKDLISYFRTALGYGTRQDFLRILNHPSRYISRFALPDNISKDPFQSMMNYYRENPSVLSKIRELKEHLHFLRELSPAAGIKYICRVIRYQEYLQEYASEKSLDPEVLQAQIIQLEERAGQFTSIQRFLEFAENELLKAPRQNGCPRTHDAVRIMTMHASKGLEFPVVFIPDLNKGIMPPGSSISTQHQEEERRLLYVAMTRSCRCLHLCYVNRVNQKQVPASIFLEELLSPETG